MCVCIYVYIFFKGKVDPEQWKERKRAMCSRHQWSTQPTDGVDGWVRKTARLSWRADASPGSLRFSMEPGDQKLFVKWMNDIRKSGLSWQPTKCCYASNWVTIYACVKGCPITKSSCCIHTKDKAGNKFHSNTSAGFRTKPTSVLDPRLELLKVSSSSVILEARACR